MLVELAEYTNVATVGLVLLAFAIVAVSICRFPAENILYPRAMSVQFVANQGPIQTAMMVVENPFSLYLEQKEQLVNAIKCRVSSKVPAVLQALWGVSIADFHHSLHSQWASLKAVVPQGKFLEDSCVASGSLLQLEPCSEQAIILSLPTHISQMNLGSIPRDKYPLVIVLYRNVDEGPTCDLDYYKTVGLLVTLVHIKDDVCPMPSCILAKYIKMVSGRVTCLRELFVANNTESANEVSGYGSVNSAEGGDCIICCVSPVKCAILPCRHACLCHQCLKRLVNCPLCRGPIHSYFAVNQTGAIDEQLSNPDPTEHHAYIQDETVLWRRFGAWNDRLNQMLGLS